MSRAGRITLGIILALLACGFLAVSWNMHGLPEMRAGEIGSFVFAIFSALGALACLVTTGRKLVLRVIGGVIFLACCWYIVAMIGDRKIASDARSKPSLLNAIGLFLLVGLPAGYVMIKGGYPRWGTHAAAFGAAESHDQGGTKPP
jgi:hypothetical protein